MGTSEITSRGGAQGWFRRVYPEYADNPRLLLYVLGVAGGGLALLARLCPGVSGLATAPFLAWLFVNIGAEFLWLETLAGEATDSMASSVNVAVIFLLSPSRSLWVIGGSVLLATRFIQRRDWVRSVFGLGQVVITAGLCGLVFHLGHPGPITLQDFGLPAIASMLAAGAVYFFVNTGLVAGAVSLERRTGFWSVWVHNYGYRNSVVSSIALFALSPILILSFLSVGYSGVLLFFLPLLIIKNQNREYINLQKMTQALISSERMAAKGEMAAEVAHEINNYLAVLSGRTQLLLLRAGRAGDETMRSDAEIIRQQIHRMSTLAKGLLDFSHKEIHLQSFDLNKLVQDTLEFVRPQNLFDCVELKAELEPDLGEVLADAGQLQQVLINLLRNAAEAMRERTEGVATAVGGTEVDAAAAAGPAGGCITVRTRRAPRGLFHLSVEDNGPGMTRAVQAKVFEPAFTTKPDGHGYGLATCYRILQSHGGRIWVESEVGIGSSFHLELPRKARVEGAMTPPAG